MTMQSRKLLVPCAWLAAIAAALLCGGIAQAKALSVCIDTSSPMAKIDQQLAQAVATHEQATLQVHDYSSEQNDDVNGMADFSALARQCELVLDFPLDTDASNIDFGHLHATRPYAHTRFVLVTRADSKAGRLGQLPKGSSVAIVYMTPPNLYFETHPDLQPLVTIHNDAAFRALNAGKVSGALLWYPSVVKYLASHPGAKLAVHPLDAPHATFNLVALYSDRNAAAAAAFERAIAAMQASGALQKTLGKYARSSAAPAASGATAATQAQTIARHRCAAPAASARHPNASAGAAAPATTAPALYTEAQANEGHKLFLDNCAVCHGDDLSGGAGPALTGPHFATAASDFHVGDIFTIVTHNMPATQPASLPHDVYLKIMAFLLQKNGYPAGKTALDYDKAMQSKVPFVYHGQ